jgi:cephalosporin-C deacetylase-like acetyl esterase
LSRNHYNVFRFSYPTAKVISESEDTVVGYYYKPKIITKKVPLIIVFPILDGDHLISEWQSKILANYGFAVIRFEKKKGFLKTDVSPEFHREILQQSIIDVRRALDWVCTWPEIDTEKIGVTGVSLGGITGSLLMAADDRIHSGAFFLFGGNFPKIIATSKEVHVTEFRERILQKMPYSELEAYLKPYYIEVDPLTYVDRFDPKKLLIISAKRDKVILPSITEDMWNKLGNPPWIKLPLAGHYSAAAYFFYGNKRMDRFFKKQFNFKPK